MNITYLIGNGFDLNLNLKTRYSDFYKYYLEKDSKNDTIKKFKHNLSNSLENWSDLEFELGKYTSTFQDGKEQEFIELLDDIQDNLADYLATQKIAFELADNMRTKIIKDIFAPSQYLNARERQSYDNCMKGFLAQSYAASLITFNYTQSIENILDYQEGHPISSSREYNSSKYSLIIKKIRHIHGTIDNNMILGVNDISQIDNQNFRKTGELLNHFVKPQMNIDAGTLRDERSKTEISSADLICIYGMSLGETDKVWWQLINKRLVNSGAVLIIFAVKEKIPLRRDYIAQTYKDKIIEKLLSYSSLTNEVKEKVKERIFVSINSEMFNIKQFIGAKKSA